MEGLRLVPCDANATPSLSATPSSPQTPAEGLGPVLWTLTPLPPHSVRRQHAIVAAAEERLSYHHILPEPAHTILAHISLNVLLHLDDEMDRAYCPLGPYAAHHRVNHAPFMNVSSLIKEVMKGLFDPTKPHFAAWVWLYDIEGYWMERIASDVDAMPSLCAVSLALQSS